MTFPSELSQDSSYSTAPGCHGDVFHQESEDRILRDVLSRTTIKHSNTTKHQHKWKTKQSPWPHPFLEQKIKKPETPNQANLSLTADWGKESRTCWATRMMKLCVVPGLFSKHLTLWQWSLACWNIAMLLGGYPWTNGWIRLGTWWFSMSLEEAYFDTVCPFVLRSRCLRGQT